MSQEVLLSLLHPLHLLLLVFPNSWQWESTGRDGWRWSSQLTRISVWHFQNHLQTNSWSGCGESCYVGCLGILLLNRLGHKPTHCKVRMRRFQPAHPAPVPFTSPMSSSLSSTHCSTPSLSCPDSWWWECWPWWWELHRPTSREPSLVFVQWRPDQFLLLSWSVGWLMWWRSLLNSVGHSLTHYKKKMLFTCSQYFGKWRLFLTLSFYLSLYTLNLFIIQIEKWLDGYRK